jgi:Ca2+-binding EF-hand superfamily protein
MRSRSAVGLVVIAALSSGFALADGGYDITAFTGADLDLSGDLSIAEFNTTLDAGLSGKAQAKSFRRADLNRNGSIQVNEFLIFRNIIRPKKALEWWFYRADISIDGALGFDEFRW